MPVEATAVRPLGVVPDGSGAPAREAMIELRSIGKSYQTKSTETQAIGNITTTFAKGEFVAIVGPSGCGKSTLLHIIAGFTEPTRGKVVLSEAAARRGKLGYIFQKDTVLPWFKVRKNIGLGPSFNGQSGDRIRAKVDELLEIAHLTQFADAYPHELSGGMRRRVALLMGLANEPAVLMLDESFSALDTHTKTHLHKELLEIARKLDQTVIMVTHDLDEAVTLADRVLVLGARPSTILLDERIDIPHPRDVFTVRQTEAFNRHYKRIWTVLGEQFRAPE
jgi:NitT/TauT family transport system ATP-binding protein